MISTSDAKTIFDQAVLQFFDPMAQKFGFSLNKLQDGIYEILGQKFAIRIRRGTGHRKGILVTLLPVQESYYNDLEKLHDEIGLGNFIKFSNKQLLEMPINTSKGYILEAEKLAKATELFIIPYLLGMKTDFIEVKEYVHKQSEVT